MNIRINEPVLGPLPHLSKGIPLLQCSSFPREESTKALTTMKRMSNRYRKSLMRSREQVCIFVSEVPVPAPVKTMRKLKECTMRQVYRRQHQFARRASTAFHILKKMTQDSPFRPPVEHACAVNLAFLKQATAEVTFRMIPATARPEAA